MATTEELIQQLVNSISNQAPMNPLLMASAYPANVSSSGITGAFSPEILLASGILTPQRINAAEQAALEQLQAQYLADISKNVEKPYEASNAYLQDIVGKYAAGTDDTSEYLRGAFESIMAGKDTPETLKVALGKANVPALVADQNKIFTALDTFAQALKTHEGAKAKYNYDVSQAADAGPAPTVEQAKTKAYEQLGLGTLAAALPSVNEQYVIPKDIFVNQPKRQALAAEAARASDALMTASSKAFPQQQYWQKEAEKYAAAGSRDALNSQIENFLARDKNVIQQQRALDAMLAKPNYMAADAIKMQERLLQEARTKAMPVAREKAMKQFASTATDLSTPKITMSDISPSYKTALAAQTAANVGIQGVDTRAQSIAQKVSDKLAAAGYTPYNQAINQLISYAISTAKK